MKLDTAIIIIFLCLAMAIWQFPDIIPELEPCAECYGYVPFEFPDIQRR